MDSPRSPQTPPQNREQTACPAAAAMKALDPTRMCFGDMLLSEFVGNHSVYYYGYANPVQTDVWGADTTVHRGWIRLAQLVHGVRAALESDSELPTTVFTISYGWIHPRLSEKIVKWKPGSQPSYHRWDEGAAVDINFHHTTFGPQYFAGDMDNEQSAWQRLSPLGIATLINTPPGRFQSLDRTITYSESPYICIACAPLSLYPGRGKWYENRWMGNIGSKPRYINHCSDARDIETAAVPSPLEEDWRGTGHPTYHGHGKLQYHHIRTSLYTMMSDWLYDRDKVHFGEANRMPTSMVRYDYIKNMMHYAGRAYDVLQALANSHLPIIEGIVMGNRTSNWEENGRWSFTIACPPLRADDHRTLHEAIQDQVIPQQGDMLRIVEVEQLPDRPYLSASGNPLQARQVRIKVTGEYDGPVEQPANRFDFTTAATSPTFREGEGLGSRDSVPDPERVSDAPPRTRRRTARTDSRRGVRTRTFRRRDES
jgi:hypothetical protein